MPRRKEVSAGVDDVVAEYAAYFLVAVKRRETAESAVEWSMDKQVMVELQQEPRQARLLVHEIGLLNPLKKQLRSKYVTIEYVGLTT